MPLRVLLDALAPPLCAGCGASAGAVEPLCTACRRELRWLPPDPVPLAAPAPGFEPPGLASPGPRGLAPPGFSPPDPHALAPPGPHALASPGRRGLAPPSLPP